LTKQPYQLEEFVTRLQTISSAEVLAAIEVEIVRVEDEVLRGPKSRHQGAASYSRRLGALLIVLSRGVRPPGAKSSDMQMFRPLAEAFIASGALDESCRGQLGYS
jgi:hypothetical protein